MATPFVWPRLEQPAVPEVEPEALPMVPPPPLGFGAAAFGATFGPELSRMAGVKVAARLVEAPDDEAAAADLASLLVIGRLPLQGDNLLFSIDRAGGAILLERMFGGRSGPVSKPVEALPPASGSWMSFARQVATACQQAARAANCAGTGTILVPVRPTAPGPDDLALGADPEITPFVYRLDVDGVAGLLLVHPLLSDASRAARRGVLKDPETLAREQEEWRRRALSLTLGLDLPVTMRLADVRMPMSRVARLAPGDVIAIEPPRLVSLMASGRCFAQLPLADLGGAGKANQNGKDKR